MRTLEKTINALVGGLLLVLFGVTFTGILARDLLNASITWEVDVSAILFIWLIFIGSIQLAIAERHMKVTFGEHALQRVCGDWAPLVSRLLIVAFCAAGVVSSASAIQAGNNVLMGSIPVPESVLIDAVVVSLSAIGIVGLVRALALVLKIVGVRKPVAVTTPAQSSDL